MSNNSRVEYIDFAKGVGMLAVLWGHVMIVGWSHNLVYGFHMPLFFFLSGMLFCKEKYPTLALFLKRRYATLIKPYLIISFVTWVIWVVYNYASHNQVESFMMPLLQTFIAQGSGNYIVHNAPLWFVPCLLFVEILYFFVCKVSLGVNLLVCTFCAIIGWIFAQPNDVFNFTKLPWSMAAGFSAVLFYALGNIFVQKKGHQFVVEWASHRLFLTVVSLFFLVLFFVVCVNYNGLFSLHGNVLGKNVLLSYAIALTGIVSTLLFSIVLCAQKNICGFANNMVLWIGRNCFFFFALHCPIKGFIIVLIAKLFGLNTKFVQTNMGYALMSFVASLICTFVVVLAVNHGISYIKKKKMGLL